MPIVNTVHANKTELNLIKTDRNSGAQTLVPTLLTDTIMIMVVILNDYYLTKDYPIILFKYNSTVQPSLRVQ